MWVSRRTAAQWNRGFTLVELVVVLALLGVLAGISAARRSDRRPFAASAAADQIVSALRTAQATAVARRQTVHVLLQPSPIAMQVCLDPACTVPVTAPGAGEWLLPADEVTLNAPATIVFTATGETTLTYALQLQVLAGPGAVNVRVEAGSGHAYRP